MASPKKTTPRAKTPPKKASVKAPSSNDQLKNYKIQYELKLIALVGATLFMMLSLYTGAVGTVGAWISTIFLGLFSYVAYVMPLLIFAFVFVRLNPNLKPTMRRVSIGVLLALIALLLTSTLIKYPGAEKAYLTDSEGFFTIESLKSIYLKGSLLEGGGVFGEWLTAIFLKLIGYVGTIIFVLVAFASSFIVFTKVSLHDLWEQKRKNMALKKAQKETEAIQLKSLLEDEKNAERLAMEAIASEKAIQAVIQPKKRPETIEGDSTQFLAQLDLAKKVGKRRDLKAFDYDSYEKEKAVGLEKPIETSQPPLEASNEVETLQDAFETIIPDPIPQPLVAPAKEPIKEKAIQEKAPTVEEPVDEVKVTAEIEKNAHMTISEYRMPPLSLLADLPKDVYNEDKSEHLSMAKRLEETLSHFNVEAKVVSVKRGPSITMFEVQLSPGVKVSKVVGLSDDIALNLATSQVRIAPIPGKTAIGIEVPNTSKSMVTMREVLESDVFKHAESKLAIGLGKDISGNPIVGDLASMPHLLIAGATGSGKSVCVNTIVSSILLNARPDEVKFLMIDPKVVELSNYNGIPHLILPVVTDSKKAAVALNWAVNEMTRRYKLFADYVVRDMKSYNKKAQQQNIEILPQIVVIIDELADLMMVAPNQVEDAICRLAQMARAAGIHLIVATQRPSVDVITGLIKANIPSRIAFSVSSAVDSRTIIDMGGAEKLLGKGDMLYYPVGSPKPKRVQGAFMSDEEVERLVSFIKNQTTEVTYNEEILDEVNAMPLGNDEVDEHLEDAISFVVDSEQASASLLQRRFRVGYNRAARLIDAMEERGIIGPPRGSKPREVLISQDALSALKSEDSKPEPSENDKPEQFEIEIEENYDS